ncbi:GntR family transcriptional regulator [uncultured Cohaesibacter sp.]|uniref:GntR family transcriptional regulator n=1 Tax=uncultured Cohaesibacter sp. TaxID=1002546 RepID=UPI00292FBB25|nr:GntR family transcriptional regulator [uncultured Cohaesibacter sp.]
MTKREANSWRLIRDEIVRRINERDWQPGDMIPNETDLAIEFECGRTTVNRALRELASEGIVIRKRKAGTRVALNPAHKAVFSIPVIREEVESSGASYRHSLLTAEQRHRPTFLAGAFRVADDTPLLYTETIHFSDNQPFIFEERYTSLEAVPTLGDMDHEAISVNEWLLQNAPYTGGEMSFFALKSDQKLAHAFGIAEGEALFATERSTWCEDQHITHVRLVYKPGYRMRAST